MSAIKNIYTQKLKLLLKKIITNFVFRFALMHDDKNFMKIKMCVKQ